MPTPTRLASQEAINQYYACVCWGHYVTELDEGNHYGRGLSGPIKWVVLGVVGLFRLMLWMNVKCRSSWPDLTARN